MSQPYEPPTRVRQVNRASSFYLWLSTSQIQFINHLYELSPLRLQRGEGECYLHLELRWIIQREGMQQHRPIADIFNSNPLTTFVQRLPSLDQGKGRRVYGIRFKRGGQGKHSDALARYLHRGTAQIIASHLDRTVMNPLLPALRVFYIVPGGEA